MKSLCLLVVLAPLAGALLAGLLGRVVGRRGAHVATILGVLVSLIGAVLVFQQVAAGQTFNGAVYTLSLIHI